jgi:glycosyltransferase involved in cell wall biosynthesis
MLAQYAGSSSQNFRAEVLGNHLMETAVLSVVIPTFNEGARIASCLQSLTGLQRRGARIIVCDGNSSDDTVEIARRHGARYCIARAAGLGK